MANNNSYHLLIGRRVPGTELSSPCITFTKDAVSPLPLPSLLVRLRRPSAAPAILLLLYRHPGPLCGEMPGGSPLSWEALGCTDWEGSETELILPLPPQVLCHSNGLFQIGLSSNRAVRVKSQIKL